MKAWKYIRFGLMIALCVLLNLGGKVLAVRYELPLWLDSFGTVMCAYAAGPVIGSIVGVTSNMIYNMFEPMAWIYALTSIALAFVVGVAAKRQALKTLFGTMTASAWAAAIAIVISLPLNILFTGGSTGNLWGDGVIAYLRDHGWPIMLCDAIGQFYIEFLDKFLTMLVFSLLIRLFPKALKPLETLPSETPDAPAGGSGAEKIAAALLAAALLAAPCVSGARAESAEVDYSDYVQTVYSSQNGLPCGEANDIAQTNDGILWIGTYAGLYRYNGSEFRWMDGYESVRNVNCLYVDGEGRLWIGTNDNGLSISINENIVNVVDQAHGLSSNSVRSIIQSTDGYYYIGTTGSMQILTLNSGLRLLNTLWEVNYADAVAADERGHVAAVTSNGRLFLLKGGRILSSRQIPGGRAIFKSCCFDRQGRLLAGTTGNQIYVFNIVSGGFEEAEVISCGALQSIKDLYFLNDGGLFVTADNGVGLLDKYGSFQIINTNDFNNSIDNMLIDYQGNLWFTSSRLGLLRMAPSAFRDVYTTAGMTARVVNTVVKWKDNYYIGTDKGMDIVDATLHRQVTNALSRSLDGVRIRCMTVDANNCLWICTYGEGLIEVEPDGIKHLYNSDNGSFGDRARLVYELSDGTMLAGGDTGISFIRDHRVQRTVSNSDGLINSMILTATELPDGRILAGTDGDGIAVLRDGEVTQMLTRKDGLSSEVILRTVKDTKSDGVFIVTSNGLCYMDEGGSIRTLDNFPYFNNYDVWAGDEDTLFVMSSAGIYVVNRDELLSDRESIGYDLLDSRRGLNSALTANAWNYYDSTLEDLFLPCDTGVFVARTDKVAAASQSYRMMISGIGIDNEIARVARTGAISIPRSASKFELYPEIINYTIQEPYVGYWLEGVEKGWTIQSQSALSSIVYANVPPGSYKFHLAVFDNDKQTMLGERVYELTKARETYDNPWFRVYLFTVPIIGVAWLTWFIVRARMQRTLDLQRRELDLARRQVEMGEETIVAIAKAVDAKDERTSQHSQRVAQYSAMIAREMGFSDEECQNLKMAAQMHDIGKIGIPDAILNKPARLTDDEYAVMKSHTLRGAEILKDFTLIEHVIEGAQYHHERYDGRGYPAGLKGEEIPIYARIIGVADAFDAMTANRVYRKQMDFGYVLEEMRKGRGTQFDPQADDILLKLIEDGKIDLNELYKPAAESQ